MEVITALRKKLDNILPQLRAVSKATLEDSDLAHQVKLDDHVTTLGNLIYYAMDALGGIGFNFRYVTASKLLHWLNPRLFVMLDNGVMEVYKLRPGAGGYAEYFIPRMRREVNEAIASYESKYECARSFAVDQIRKRAGGRTIPRILDIFNLSKTRAVV